MKASDFIAKFLEINGTKYAFGMSGGAILHLVDSLYNKTSIQVMSGSNEQFSAFEADGYARSLNCEHPGVCFATSGPGATNLITGVATAYYDSIPLIVFSGQVARHRQKKDLKVRQLGFQELPISLIIEPIVKATYKPEHVDELPSILEAAWNISLSGRKGPVHIELADDLQRDDLAKQPSRCKVQLQQPASSKSLDTAVIDQILSSRYPLFLIGNGARQATANIREFLKQYEFPAISTWAAIDIASGLDGYIGVIGTYSPVNNFLIDKCDLLISLGCRLSNNIIGSQSSEFAKDIKKIIVDIDGGELEKLKQLNISNYTDICMDVGSFIVKTSDSLNKRQYTKGTYSYFKKLSEEEYAKQPSNSAISKLDILINAACINSKLQGIFLDTGNNLAWSCNILSRINRRLPPIFSSWNNTPMGYSLPAAIGFCLASDRQPTMAVIGDGGLALCMSELAMVKKLNLPLLIIVVENNGHNIQKQTIDTWLEGNYSVVDESTNLFLPSFERIGEFFNIPSFSIDSNFDEESIYNLNLTSDRPTIVKIQISDDARSYPIVLFGNKITECIVQ